MTKNNSTQSLGLFGKRCVGCHEIKGTEQFTKSTKWSCGRRNYCYTCQNRWANERSWKLKRQLADMLGGVCEMCGFGDIRALGFHHKAQDGKRDREQSQREKSGNKRGTYYSVLIRRLKTEPDFLSVLCCNCHTILHCQQPKGPPKPGRTKLTPEQAKEILTLKGAGLKITDLEKRFNIARCVIKGIWKGTLWKTLTP